VSARKIPLIALVGRMNVGKSTLFNRLSSSVKALTLDYAGVTRDVLHDVVEWQGKTFELVDTGGLTFDKTGLPIETAVAQQAMAIIDKADVVVLVVDGTVGIVPVDRRISDILHRKNKKVIVAVNKADRSEVAEYAHEAARLGHSAWVLVSAQHGTGIAELLELMIKELPPIEKTEPPEPDIKVLLLGRPNVGKSSLMNALLNYERAIVADVPGTTREPLTESVMFYKQSISLTDTAGVRRKKAVKDELETMMTQSTFQALRRSHIVLLLIDATQGALAKQDLRLAFYAFETQAKALIILVNKVDIATKEQLALLKQHFDAYPHLIAKIPVLFISCVTGKDIGKVLPLIEAVRRRYNQEFDAAELMQLFSEHLSRRPLVYAGKRFQMRGVRQIKRAPITIALRVNYPEWFGPSQCAFLENIMRENYDLKGVPIRFKVEGKKVT